MNTSRISISYNLAAAEGPMAFGIRLAGRYGQPPRKPEMAQAGGKDAAKLGEAIAAAKAALEKMVG